MALIQAMDSGGYTFRFGKFQGCTLDEVAKIDPDYLVWAWKTLSEEDDRSFMDAVEDKMVEHKIAIP